MIKITTLDSLHERRGVLVTVNGIDIALFKRQNEVFAINNVCAHQHFSMLHQGEVQHETVTCPMHGWAYDVRTGKSLNGQGKVPCYPVKVIGQDVWIELPQE